MRMFLKNKSNNPLKAFFQDHNGPLIHKWLHYFDIYHAHFNKYRGKKVTILEFGVSHGGSLEMWKKYFGKKAQIIGVDINPECKKFEAKNVQIFIGDQSNRKFLRDLIKQTGPVDILIDDGGHTMEQQIVTFEELYAHIKENGVYLAEDLHTSYWSEFGGGLRKQGSFIEIMKEQIDQLNAWHSRDKESLKVDKFTKNSYSMHFYDSVVVIEKKKMVEPSHKQRGKQTLKELEEWAYRKNED